MTMTIPPPPPKHLAKRNAMLAKRKNYPLRVTTKPTPSDPIPDDALVSILAREREVESRFPHDKSNFDAACGVLGMMSEGQAWMKVRREERRIEDVGCTLKMNNNGQGVPDWKWRKLAEQDPTRSTLKD